MSDNVIAIDGPAASGKSTVAQRLSEKLNALYVNTGNMYRAITWAALQNGIDLNPPKQKQMDNLLAGLELDYVKSSNGSLQLFLNGEVADGSIRSPEVAKYVSHVAAMPNVRLWLINRQRSLSGLGLIVMEGRDIGTVVFPDAKYKFFLTASPEVRAYRRLKQKGEIPENATVASVAGEILQRDKIDSKRKIAPLRMAEDAVCIDTTEMTIEEVVEFIIEKVSRDECRVSSVKNKTK